MENSLEKSDKIYPPVVAIDGTKTRTIRETKKLTQLYVASVVGVTTDTISRWENNRYPTIKRDNAEKLAAALEVELTEILQQEGREEEIPAPITEPASAPQGRLWLLPVLALVGVLVALAALFLTRQAAAPAVAVRWLPHFATPGEIIPVQLKISRSASNPRGFIVKERLPAGWRLVSAVPAPAAGQQAASELKWLIPSGSSPVTISYTVRPSPDSPLQTTATFAGSIVIHGDGETRSGAIGDNQAITVAGIHWADQNGDGRIDDNEIMPAYYLTEEMKGLGLDWKTIEAIWSGKGYRWDGEKKEYVVVK